MVESTFCGQCPRVVRQQTDHNKKWTSFGGWNLIEHCGSHRAGINDLSLNFSCSYWMPDSRFVNSGLADANSQLIDRCDIRWAHAEIATSVDLHADSYEGTIVITLQAHDRTRTRDRAKERTVFIQMCFASEVASDAVQGSAEARAFGTAWVKVRGIDAVGAEQFEFKADLHAFSVPDRIDWPHLKKDIGCPYDCV